MDTLIYTGKLEIENAFISSVTVWYHNDMIIVTSDTNIGEELDRFEHLIVKDDPRIAVSAFESDGLNLRFDKTYDDEHCVAAVLLSERDNPSENTLLVITDIGRIIEHRISVWPSISVINAIRHSPDDVGDGSELFALYEDTDDKPGVWRFKDVIKSSKLITHDE